MGVIDMIHALHIVGISVLVIAGLVVLGVLGIIVTLANDKGNPFQ